MSCLDSTTKCIVVNFIGLRGGGVSYAYEMTRGLCRNGCRVYAIISVEMENFSIWKEIDGLRIIEVSGYSTKWNFLPRLIRFFVLERWRIARILNEVKVDAVYLPMTSFWASFGNSLLKRHRMIYTMHDPIPHSRKNIIPNMISHKCARDADAIIVLSDTFREFVHTRYEKPYSKIFTIPLGSQEYYSTYRFVHGTNGHLVHYPENRINFLFYGRLTDYKGLGILARAYRKLSTEFDDVTLTIAGNGSFSPYSVDYADLPNFTLINRWIGEEEVLDLFQGKNIITVVPYTSASQSGVIPIAMQFGSPIIASRCGGLIEQVKDKVTGYLVSPGDSEDLFRAMKHVIENQDELESIRQRAYDHIRSLDWTHLARQVVEIVSALEVNVQ